jgi:hypothetical protein
MLTAVLLPSSVINSLPFDVSLIPNMDPQLLGAYMMAGHSHHIPTMAGLMPPAYATHMPFMPGYLNGMSSSQLSLNHHPSSFYHYERDQPLYEP